MEVSEDFVLEAPPLPHDLAGPLHILDFDRIAWALAAVAALLMLLWAVYLWRRVLRPAIEAQPKTPRRRRPIRDAGIRSTIVKLYETHRIRGSFRQGCHDLAELLRGHFQSTFQQPYSTYTVGEILDAQRRKTVKADGGPVANLFRRLEELQFRRREPAEDEFRSVCDEAKDVVGGTS